MQTDASTGPQDPQGKAQIKAARGNFLAMAASYFLGSLNDNFYKQAAMLMAVACGMLELQGWATVLYTVPFLLFAAYAGYLSDRHSKRRVVIAAKALELVAMIFGAAGMILGSWNLMLLMIFLMGTQAAIFSPAINGSIPELYPVWHVTQANALMKVASTAAILLGVAGASVAMGAHSPGPGGVPWGRWLVAIAVIVLAVAGLAVSFGVPRRPAASPGAPFPLLGPLDTIRELLRTLGDPLLAMVIAIDAYMWFLGALIVMLINPMGMKQFGYDEPHTGTLVFAELGGFAIGGLIAGKALVGPNWYRWLGPSALAMSVFMMTVAIVPILPVPWQGGTLAAILGAIGLFGGLMLVPLESFIQVHPSPQRRGTVIAAANFAAFAGILMSGPQANRFFESGAPPTVSLAIMGAVTAAVGAAVVPILTLRR